MKIRVIEQHAEEAAFLWLLRRQAARAPHYRLTDLAELDGRVEAHLDGLRIAGAAGWDACRRNLAEHGEPGELFAAAALAFDGGDARRAALVLDAASASPALERAAVSALGWLPYERARPAIERLLAAEAAVARRIGLGASAAHRQDPGDALDQALLDEDSGLAARALRAAGELGRVDRMPELAAHLEAPDPGRRLAAAWSAARLGDGRGVKVLTVEAERGGRKAERAAATALRRVRGRPGRELAERLGERPGCERAAVIAAGALGDVELVPWLIERMRAPALSRIAGEAFSLITGIDLEAAQLTATAPDGFRAGPTDDPEDEDVVMDPDRDLPWPRLEAVRAAWEARRGSFLLGTRYLLGMPAVPRFLGEVLARGGQRARAAAALELAMRRPREPLFEVRAPGFRQRVG